MKVARLSRNGEITTWEKETPDLVVKNVCRFDCNAGWMSVIEDMAKPIMTPMIAGEPIALSTEQQVIIAIWTIKTAMVLDSMDGGGHFYSQDDRYNFRETRDPGAYISIWLGHYGGHYLQTFIRHGIKASGKPGPTFNAYIVTLAIGRLVFQFLEFKFPHSENRPGFRVPTALDWNSRTSEILDSRTIQWPPSLSLDDSSYTFDAFSNRFGKLL